MLIRNILARALALLFIGASCDVASAIPRKSEIALQQYRNAVIAKVIKRNFDIELVHGSQVEQTAYSDSHSLMYFTGPFYEIDGLTGKAAPIGDLFFHSRIEFASRESELFASNRYFFAVNGARVEFGYGGWKPEYRQKYAFFIGGLGYLFNEHGVDSEYRDPYGSMAQRMHNIIPRERMVIGRDNAGDLMVMKTSPMLQEESIGLAKRAGMVEAYFLDQGNRARLIVPGILRDTPKNNLAYMMRVF